MADAEHRCAAGRSCRDRERTTGEDDKPRWLPALIEAERGLCERCEFAVKRALRELAADWGILSSAVGDKLMTGSEHVSGTHDAPIPINTGVLALRSTLSEWAEVALGIVCPVLNIVPRERQRARGFPIREAAVISQAVQVLPENLRILLDAEPQPVNVWNREGMSPLSADTPGWDIEELDGVAVALHILRAHAQIRNVLGDSNPRTRLAMPCPVLGCGSMTLGVDNGETDVDCTSCGGRWSDREYAWLAGMIVSESDTKTRERKSMFEWLLAEKTWQLEVVSWLIAELEYKLIKVRVISELSDDEVAGLPVQSIVKLLFELLAA